MNVHALRESVLIRNGLALVCTHSFGKVGNDFGRFFETILQQSLHRTVQDDSDRRQESRSSITLTKLETILFWDTSVGRSLALSGSPEDQKGTIDSRAQRGLRTEVRFPRVFDFPGF